MGSKTKLVFIFCLLALGAGLVFKFQFAKKSSLRSEVLKQEHSNEAASDGVIIGEDAEVQEQKETRAVASKQAPEDYSVLTIDELDIEIAVLEKLMEDERAIETLNSTNSKEVVDRWAPIFEKLTMLQNAQIEKKISQLAQSVSELEEEYVPSHKN